MLHFATHGFSDELLPLRSALVLNAGPGEDGLLEAQEIIQLKLDASLVVLSGCSTGAGRLRAGEGVQSLARAFLLAGARSVVSTRWPVPDGGARALIEGFYARLGQGEDAAAALSLARAEQLRRGAPPRDWAGFSLVGARSRLVLQGSGEQGRGEPGAPRPRSLAVAALASPVALAAVAALGAAGLAWLALRRRRPSWPRR